ncbi:MAG: Txe/YoeB family addiction module toxin [Candidatus Gastranaerophilales bacterium]|nr:Txe/YoeB family addiction module toxin [Candidatus Gastranaerophilales bacterium]
MQIERIQWDYDAWEEYCEWQRTDKIVVKRINALIRDIRRNPFEGIGKPEPLKGKLSGFWSRRIDKEHRIVYAVENDNVMIIACRGHYE